MARRSPDPVALGEAVKRTRLAYEMSQAAVAEEAGVSQRLVSKIERGGCRRPSLSVVRVLDVLDLPTETAWLASTDEPIRRVTEDRDREENLYAFWPSRRPGPIEFQTTDQVVERLPKSAFDVRLILHGPAHFKVGPSGRSLAVTVRFDGQPDAMIVIEEDREY